MNHYNRVRCLFAVIGSFALSSGLALAQKSDGPNATDGEPIYLEEPEAPPEPQLVENTTQTQKYDNGQVRIEQRLSRYSDDSLVSNGSYREYYPTGQLFVEGQYAAGLSTGEWTYYHPDGQTAKKVTFKAGQPEGKVEAFNPKGVLVAEREFKQGKRHGVWKDYSDDGKQLRRQQSYDNGLPDGVWKNWYESGEQLREQTFKAGKRVGVFTEWYDNGEKRIEASYKDGQLDGKQTRWSDDGAAEESFYKAGKLVQ